MPGVLPPLPKHRRSRRKLAIVVVAVLLIIGGGSTAALLLTRKHGPSYPKAWDARIEPLARRAAKLRDLEFKHPVYVEFLTPAEYTKKSVGEDEGDPSQESKDQMADYVALYRSVGLLQGKVDLLDAGKTLADSGTLAFYDQSDKHIYIRGTKLTVDLKVTLIHELTHALQDQNFDLTKTEKAFDKDGGDSLAFRALVEGDATEVENRYIDGLSHGDREEYDQAQQDQSSNDDAKKVQALPAVLLQVFGAPYSFGPRFVSVLRDTGGEDAVDDAFHKPPKTFAEVWNPFAYLDGQETKKVPAVKLPKGAKSIDDTPTGNFVLYLILAQRNDPLASLDAADTWRGDSSLAYKQNGKICFDMHVETANTNDRNLLGNALTTWQKAMPAGVAKVTKSGRTGVMLHTCDPGEKADLHVSDISDALLAYPVTRIEIASDALEQSKDGNLPFNVGPEAAYCYSNRLMRIVPAGAITGALADWTPDASTQGRIQNALSSCVGEHP